MQEVRSHVRGPGLQRRSSWVPAVPGHEGGTADERAGEAARIHIVAADRLQLEGPAVSARLPPSARLPCLVARRASEAYRLPSLVRRANDSANDRGVYERPFFRRRPFFRTPILRKCSSTHSFSAPSSGGSGSAE